MGERGWTTSPISDVPNLSGDSGAPVGSSGGVPGAIARAVRRSTSPDRDAPLPNVDEQLRADRARAILQRDQAIGEAQLLREEIIDLREQLRLVRDHSGQVDSFTE